MAISNLELQNSTNLWQLGQRLTNLFPCLTTRTIGIHLLWCDFKCDFHWVIHSRLKPTNGKPCYQATCMEKKQSKHPQVNLTSFGATWVFPFVLLLTTFFPQRLEHVYLCKFTTLGSISLDLCSTMGKLTTLFYLLRGLINVVVFTTTIVGGIPCFSCSFELCNNWNNISNVHLV
jgi:hypothetical protein